MVQIVSQSNVSNPSQAFGSATLPSYQDVLGEWWPGSEASGITNRITRVDATLIGAPSQSAGFMNVGSTSSAPGFGFTTDVGAHQSSLSLLALVRPSSIPDLVKFLSPSGDHFNYNMCFGNAGAADHISFGNGHTIGSTDQSVLTIDPTKFNMVMGVGILSTPGRLYSTTGGDTPATVFDDGGTPFEPTAREMSPLQVGGFWNAGWSGSVDVAAVALVDGAKDADYIEAVYSRWRNFAESLGLTVA